MKFRLIDDSSVTPSGLIVREKLYLEIYSSLHCNWEFFGEVEDENEADEIVNIARFKQSTQKIVKEYTV